MADLTIVKKDPVGEDVEEQEEQSFFYRLDDLDIIPDILELPKENAVSIVKELYARLIPNAVTLNGGTYCELQITPALAKVLLVASQGNRSIRKATLQKYIWAIEHDQWIESVNSMMIMNSFQLGDAHHRLWALIITKKTMGFLVRLDTTLKELAAIDNGRLRSDSDRVSIMTQETISPKITNILKNVIIFDNGKTMNGLKVASTDDRIEATSFNHNEIAQEYSSNPELTVQAVAYAQSISKKLCSPNTIGYTYYVLCRQFKREAMKFFEDLKTGTGLSGTDIIYLLREKLISLKSSGLNGAHLDVEFLIFKAWDIFHNGREVPKNLIRGGNESIRKPY